MIQAANFRFAHIEYFHALWAIAVFIIVFILYKIIQQKKIKLVADSNLLTTIIPDFSSQRTVYKFILFSLAYISFVCALARPQFGFSQKETTKSGIEVVIALDVSNSMLAQDIKPSRLQKAKLSIQRILNSMYNDKVAIVVFAGDAHIQLPLTNDVGAAKMFLQNVSTRSVKKQGTAIAPAITKAMLSFTDNPKSKKAILIISDGEDHEEQALVEAKKAAEKNIIIHTIGLGNPQGVLLPNPYSNGYLTDKQGKPVVSKLNEQILKDIARIGNGIYAHDNFSAIMKALDELEKTEFDSAVYSQYDEKFMYFLYIGILLLCIEFVLLERKNKWLKHIDLFTIK